MTPAGAKPTSLPLLTEMRGVAALLIFHMHLGFYLPFLRVLSWGYLGVDFFFILSGYVLTHVYRDWFYPNFRPKSFRNFFWARFGRVYPLYFFTCGLYLLLTGLLLSKWPVRGYLHEIFALNFLPRWPGQNPVSWSIGSEGAAYIFAPFLIHWIRAEKPWRIGAALLFSAFALYSVVFFRPGYQMLDVHTFSRCLPEFILGICYYEICNRWRPGARLATAVGAGAFLCAIASLLFVPVKAWRDLACVLSFSIVIPTATCLRGPFVRGFNLLFGYLGEISYSIYLVHPLLLLCFTRQIMPLVARSGLSHTAATALVYSLTTALLILLSGLSYRYIELPARSFFKRATQRPAANSTPAKAIPADIVLAPAMDESAPGR
ncbi:MAG TPA: acyltransferase [Verrucomicrobiae bacterium]